MLDMNVFRKVDQNAHFLQNQDGQHVDNLLNKMTNDVFKGNMLQLIATKAEIASARENAKERLNIHTENSQLFSKISAEMDPTMLDGISENCNAMVQSAKESVNSLEGSEKQIDSAILKTIKREIHGQHLMINLHVKNSSSQMKENISNHRTALNATIELYKHFAPNEAINFLNGR